MTLPVKYERIVDSDTPSKTDKLRTKKLKPDQNLDATATAMMQQKQYFSQIYMNSLSLPLSQQFRMRVQCIFNQPCNNDVQGKREVTSLNGHSVNLSSMRRLQPATDEYGIDLKTQTEREARYLNDEIVNYYFRMLEIQNRNETYVQHNSLHSPRCAFFSSFLMKKILYDSDKSPRAYNYERVKRWSIRICDRFGVRDIFCLDKLYIPICYNKHWSCIIVHMREKIIQRYDPMNFRDGGGHLETVMNYIQDEFKHYREGEKEPDWREWTVQDTFEYSCPTQTNSVDCGMFVLFFAYLTSIDLPLEINQCHINVHARDKVALSILHHQLMI